MSTVNSDSRLESTNTTTVGIIVVKRFDGGFGLDLALHLIDLQIHIKK